MKILPSLISSDLLNLEKTINLLNPYCDGYHIDVMDDHFVPNLTWGPAFVKAIIKKTNLPILLHLMVDNPLKWINRVKLREDDIFVFHFEALKSELNINELINNISKINCKIGIAVNPSTSIDLIFPYLNKLDYVLIMSVEPGFSGQKFIDNVVNKIEPLVKKRKELNANFVISMDGGISADNIKMLNQKGVEQFGIASAIFSHKDFVSALKKLRS